MAEDTYVALTKRIETALKNGMGSGDPSEYLALFADDVEFTSPNPPHVVEGASTTLGMAELDQFMRTGFKLMGAGEADLDVETVDVFLGVDGVVWVWRTKDGNTGCDVIRMNDEGLISRQWVAQRPATSWD
ncbi:MAG: nuclear transport factor 2 family protein [Acidimicrobiia bacterium]